MGTLADELRKEVSHYGDTRMRDNPTQWDEQPPDLSARGLAYGMSDTTYGHMRSLTQQGSWAVFPVWVGGSFDKQVGWHWEEGNSFPLSLNLCGLQTFQPDQSVGTSVISWQSASMS